MLIAVKEFKMPESCMLCPMQFAGMCIVAPSGITDRVAESYEEALIMAKPKWCPLVEVEEKHAHWIERGGIYACSHCDAEDGVMTKFCSSCGYQMDGGAENGSD